MFFKKKSFNKPKPPVKKVTKKWEPTIDLSLRVNKWQVLH